METGIMRMHSGTPQVGVAVLLRRLFGRPKCRSRHGESRSCTAVLAAVGAFGDSSRQDEMQRYVDNSGVAPLGFAVAFSGDHDGDGKADIILGAPLAIAPNQDAKVHLYSSSSGALLQTIDGEGPNDYFGISVAGVGDVDGDGVPDIAAGSTKGYARVVSGADPNTDLSRLTSPVGSTTFGSVVAAVGDITLDGVPDLLVADPGEDSGRGVVYFFSGCTGNPIFSMRGESQGDAFGSTIALAGKCDGDAFDDFVIGAPEWGGTSKKGKVYLFRGYLGVLFATHEGFTDERLGVALASVGDTDGDGADDILVGGRGVATESAVLVSGASGARRFQMTGPSSGGRFGSAVARAGDVDGDGYPDLAIGAPRDTGYGGVGGRIFIHSGYDGVILRSINLLGIADWGTSLAGGVDADGDGNSDLLIGGPVTGTVVLSSIAFLPDILSVTPDRGRYTGGIRVTVAGHHFLPPGGGVSEVRLDGEIATNVNVIDDSTLQFDTPQTDSGVAPDLQIRNSLGVRAVAGLFKCTPYMLTPTGDLRPDGFVLNTYLCQPGDTIYAIYGTDSGSIPIPPFVGTFGIDPFAEHFIQPAWPFDTHIHDDDLPNDPSLSGLTILCQALVGPKLAGKRRDGATTNVASFVIQ